MSAPDQQSANDTADMLPNLVRAAREIADLLGMVTNTACCSPDVLMDVADELSDVGEEITHYSRVLMREVRRRQRAVEPPLAPPS